MNQPSIFIIIIIFSACISQKRKEFNDALYWSTRYGEFPYLVLNVKTNNRSEKILLTSLDLAASIKEQLFVSGSISSIKLITI